jgi:hypothetical protein
MIAPSVPFGDWILAACDPVLLLLALFLGWKADQFGKVFIAAIIALVVAIGVAWLFHMLGVPWPAPIGGELPMLLPVRTVAALVAAILGYCARKILRN